MIAQFASSGETQPFSDLGHALYAKGYTRTVWGQQLRSQAGVPGVATDLTDHDLLPQLNLSASGECGLRVRFEALS